MSLQTAPTFFSSTPSRLQSSLLLTCPPTALVRVFRVMGVGWRPACTIRVNITSAASGRLGLLLAQANKSWLYWMMLGSMPLVVIARK